MVESSLVLWGERIIALSSGKPAEVEFDFETVWAFRDKTKLIFKQQELTWLHVHPIGYGTQASSTDQNCAEGLHIAFGNLGWFGILCFSDPEPDNIYGEIAWYRWVKNKLQHENREGKVQGRRQENIRFDIYDWFREDIHIPYVLKALSLAR